MYTIDDEYSPADKSLMINRTQPGQNVASITVVDETTSTAMTVRVDRQKLMGILNSI